MSIPSTICVERLLDRTYRAEVGDFTGHGRTKSDAVERLLVAIRDEARHDTAPVVKLGPDGGVWAFWRMPGAWTYRLPSGSTTVYGADVTRTRALEMFEAHFAQYYERGGACAACTEGL